MKKILVIIFLLFCWSPAWATDVENIGIIEHVGQNIDLGLQFRDEQGGMVPLKTFFDGERPVVLSLVYYECPSLCTLVLNGLTEALKNIKGAMRDQFQVVTVSINPKEGTGISLQKKQAYLAEYGRPSADQSWHFLTGAEENIKALSDQVGFNYYYDQEQKQYVHLPALFILTPHGKISRYLHGTHYQPLEVTFALQDAAEGKIAGEKLFVEKGCISCHSPTGPTGAGPTLKGLFGSEVELVDGRMIIADENYIRESIVEPFAKQVKGYPPLMPAFKGTLTDPEINALVAYIRGLK